MSSSSSSSAVAAALDGDEEAFEHTLLVVREVSVYKIPPRSTSGGYKCGEWLQTDKIWSGRLRVVSCKERCEIRLEDPNSGDLFAACFVLPGQREASVETVLDSSRYFVLKIEDGRGKHAFIGLGFTERNEAFDFNVALSDHDKYVRREHEKEYGDGGGAAGGPNDSSDHIDIHPAVNHRLKVSMMCYLEIQRNFHALAYRKYTILELHVVLLACSSFSPGAAPLFIMVQMLYISEILFELASLICIRTNILILSDACI